MTRPCEVPFCSKISSRTKDRFCAAHRSELHRKGVTPFNSILPYWAIKHCKQHGLLGSKQVYLNSCTNVLICRICISDKNKIKYNPALEKIKNAKKKIQNRNRVIKCKYDLTTKQYESMLIKQNHLCAICLSKSEKSLHIDHCHNTGKVRGLLCMKCNVALGYFNDSIQSLERAIEYLS